MTSSTVTISSCSKAALISVSEGNMQVSLIKSDAEFFSRLYIGCQAREGNLQEFLFLFCHENQAYPPALSDCGYLYLDTKSDLLSCLQAVSGCQCDAPVVDAIINDEDIIIQMLKSGTVKYFDCSIYVVSVQKTSCVNTTKFWKITLMGAFCTINI